MVFLRHMRIWGKALVIKGLFAVLCAGIVAYAAYIIIDLAEGTHDLVHHEAVNLHRAATARENMTMMHQLAFEINNSESSAWGQLQQAFDAEVKSAKDALGAMRAIATGEAETKGIDEANAALDQYVAVVSQIGALLPAGRRDEAAVLLKSTGKPIFERADAIFDQVVEKERKELDNAATKAAELAQSTLMLMLASSLLGLLLVSAASLFILRSEISAPLARVTNAMNKLAQGDLEVVIEGADRRDEIGELARAFGTFRQAGIDKEAAESESVKQSKLLVEERSKALQAQAAAAKEQNEVVAALGNGLANVAAGDLMFRITRTFPASYEKLREDFNGAMDKLQDVMKALKSCALEIRAGSAEISQSAEELSRRTEQQAASLEETAAALAEINAAVRRTADGTGEASSAVGAARSEAERSASVVRDAVRAMGEIENSARQISQIIGVIDEIAFQTNLLALNAGVEAARAGDAGRGFAVVASEVRALAQRSASAAKEIKALISTSSGQVGAGVQLVGQTGQTLDRILTSIADINKLVAEMAQSAKEQSAGLHEINSAIDQMDSVTQQNASMVEESTAASFVLASETQELTALIDRFKIDSGEIVQEPKSARKTAASTPQRKAHSARSVAPKRIAAGGAATARKIEPQVSAQDWEEF
jgi:methyl-accepting chemotaxis protein